jgi:sarcosine oxidase subunit alpha
MTGAFRTPAGGRIDRTRPLRFTFDGRVLHGAAGDTLASALLANGVHQVGRSFKYHRRRGILAAGAEEPNALVTVTRDAARVTPNLRATQVELYQGLRADSQNRWPSLDYDAGAVANLLAPLLPAGFYYKTFKWPAWAWHRLYEPAIRAAAGLGRAPAHPDPDRYAQCYAHCDVLVVGAGPAGLAAATAAADAGARVVLCDEQAEMGGSLLADTGATIDGGPAKSWLAATLAALMRAPRVTLLARTTAFGCFAQNMVALVQRVTDHLAAPPAGLPRERLWLLRARQVVIAAGALERPLVFPHNDRPGIMLADAARTYLARYGVRVGRRAVVATAHDSAYDAALALHAAGVEVAAIADQRPSPGAAAERARAAGLTVRPGTVVATTGGRRRVAWAGLMAAGGGATEPVACDTLLMCGGWTPSVHLVSQARGALRFAPPIQAFVPNHPAEGQRAAGACRGVFGLPAALADGAAGGEAAAHASGHGGTRGRLVAVEGCPAWDEGGTLGLAPGVPAGRAFIDFQNDVTARDVQLATREGFRAIEHVKRYTTAGMATDQGKTSNMNALGVAAAALARPVPDIGLTTFRMPYTPVTFGSLAGPARGDLLDPVRQTPLHDRAAALGAVFEDVGQWRRARYFPRAGEGMASAIARECHAVRSGAGLFDASTLGKIEVAGPDAARFLDRIYVNAVTRVPVGRCRYAVLCGEDGFIMDDGIIARLAPDRFHVTTTTGGAARVLSVMEDYLQTEWPEMEAWLTSVTEQWAVIAVQGPRARAVLAPLVEGIDLAPAAFAHMSVAEGRVAGVPARLFRVSFTGELGFEVNVPADFGPAVWDAVLAAGAAHGLTPYGTEAMHVLRAEKGYIVVGQDTDGTVTPDDAGLGWTVGRSKADFVGRRSLTRAAMSAPGRKQLVGLLTEDGTRVLEEGAQLVADPQEAPPMRLLGHVSSAYHSAALGHPIALALLKDGRARIGERLFVTMPDGAIPVRVTAPVFYDPDGTRLHG